MRRQANHDAILTQATPTPAISAPSATGPAGCEVKARNGSVVMRWVLPWVKVSANNLYFTRRGRRVLSPAAEAWRNEAILCIRATMPRVPEGDLSLSIQAFEPDKRRRDTDGLIKPVQDAVALALDFDDTRIRDVRCHRYAKGEGYELAAVGVHAPCVVVTLEGDGSATPVARREPPRALVTDPRNATSIAT